jgi:hypothetical protein
VRFRVPVPLAYRNVLRIQGWIGSLCRVAERELFGQEPVSEANGATVGARIEREMHQLDQTLMPLLDRAHRVLVRSLDRLEPRRSRGTAVSASILRLWGSRSRQEAPAVEAG